MHLVLDFPHIKSIAIHAKFSETLLQVARPVNEELLVLFWEVFGVLCDPRRGIRYFLEGKVSKQALVEDAPIETHITRLFEFANVGACRLADANLAMLRTLGCILGNEMGIRVFLYIVSKGFKFDFWNAQTALVSERAQTDYGYALKLFDRLFEILHPLFDYKDNLKMLAILFLTSPETSYADYKPHLVPQIKSKLAQLCQIARSLQRGSGNSVTELRLGLAVDSLERFAGKIEKNEKRVREICAKADFAFFDVMPVDIRERYKLYRSAFENNRVQVDKITRYAHKEDLASAFQLVPTLFDSPHVSKPFY